MGQFLITVDLETYNYLQDRIFAKKYLEEIQHQASEITGKGMSEATKAAPAVQNPDVIWKVLKNPIQNDVEATSVFLSLYH
ncbi:unnamed protein product [Callosobruchus maculatus]|uniref:Uncharacterized protein n=1 Tax=Callosobruchus maculatus TaxID=64391 RepID=A0A653CKK9_CALMS|nr:unnamed protein product [Callosobruchus maculatus]